MPLLPLALPPGMMGNGTRYQSVGRWRDGSLVRFVDGTIRPVRGWAPLTQDAAVDPTVTLDGVCRSIQTWRGDDGAPTIGMGTNTKWYAHILGTLYDITPAGFTTGAASGTFASGGYGSGPYGAGPYGGGSGEQSLFTPAAVWHQDTFGQYLVGCCAPNDGVLYYWDRNTANVGVVLDASAPTDCSGVVVTPERFVVALGAGGVVRRVEWASQESLTDWTPTDTNTAGGFDLDGRGALVAGRRGKGETLLWTTDDLWAMRYIGGLLVYGFERVGDRCGLVAPGAVAVVDTRAFWMGPAGFFSYDGYTRPLPSEVSDRVFSDFNLAQSAKVTAFSMAEFGEVWWHYPSGDSDENNRYVVFNYRENHWTTGTLERTAGCDAGPSRYVLAAASNGTVYEHGRGTERLDTDGTTELLPFLDSGPVELGTGEELMFVSGVLPDDEVYGDVSYTLYGAMEPGAEEETVGPFTLDAELDTRFTARQVRVRIETVSGTGDWRASPPRLRVSTAGRRGSTRAIPSGFLYDGVGYYNGRHVFL